MRATTLPNPADRDEYLLPRDEFEKKRLILQQTVIVRQFDNRLLAPGVELKEDDHVLDVGCGTGIWSINLAARSPQSVHFEACDLSSKNFLDVKPLGINNIHFSTCSILALPEEWTGRFTVVQSRLMHASITVEEWRQGFQELMRVLKPGGWLQVVEIDLSSFYNDGLDNISKSPVPAQAELNAIWSDVVKNAGMMWELEGQMRTLVTEAGFENIKWESKVFSTEGGDASASNAGKGNLADDTLACMVNVMRSSKRTITGTGKISEERFDQNIEAMANGWKDVAKTEQGRGWRWHFFSAQKPLHTS